MHPFRREQRELQLDFRGALVVLGDERFDDVPRDFTARRRHGGARAAELQRRQQHLHGREIARMPGAVDFDDQARHAGEVARAFLDQLHFRQFRQRDVSAMETSAPGPGLR